METQNGSAAALLSSLRQQLHQRKRMSASEARALLQLCHHPIESIREAALLLFLHPPVEDELAHYVDLLVSPPGHPPLLQRDAPLAVHELAFDLIAACRGLPSSPALRTSLDRLLRRSLRFAQRSLVSGRFLLRELADDQSSKLIAAFSGKRATPVGSKLRLLLHHLRVVRPLWAEATTGDLSPLWQNPRTRRKKRLTRGRWLRVCRALTIPVCDENRAPSPSRLGSLKISYWGGYGQRSLCYLDRLFRLQAQEIAAQRNFCNAVSAKTHRVVLSLHNATVAAVGGWGFEPLSEAFPDGPRRQAFIHDVMQEARRIEKEDPEAARQLEAIWELWRDRLIRPKLMQALRDRAVRSSLDPHLRYDYEQDVNRVRLFLPDVDSMATLEGNRHTLMGAVAPHQRTDLAETLSWGSQRRRLWKPGWMQLAAMLLRGQTLLDRGGIAAFALPWIDKFFMSSRRDKDIVYLPAVIRWLHARGAHPVVLFWEDTAHARQPSFQLAMEQMITAGARFRGIGIFGDDASDRSDAQAIIVSEHARTDLFALRPGADVHLPRSFHQLLGDLDPCLFLSYDSSWKDNLSFVYFGTQVASLLSVQTEMESFPPWVIVDGIKEPFGAFLRRTLRRNVQRGEAAAPDLFWSCYQAWANLG